MVDRGGRFSEENGRARGCGLQNNQLMKCCLEYLKAYMAYLLSQASFSWASSVNLVGCTRLTG